MEKVDFWEVSCSLKVGLIEVVLTVHYQAKDELKLVEIDVVCCVLENYVTYQIYYRHIR